MKIDNPTGDPDCRKPQYRVRFEPREVSDIHFGYPRRAFERVEAVSNANETFYRTVVSPWVRALSTPWSASLLKLMHPMRTSRLMFSEKFNPWMAAVAAVAASVRTQRKPLDAEDPAAATEHAWIEDMTQTLAAAREQRDRSY